MLRHHPSGAYVAADRLAFARAAAAGDRRATSALKVLERLSFMLSGAQLGITVTGPVVGFLAESFVSALLKPVLTRIGIPDSAITGIAVALAFVFATVLQLVLGELAPTNLGRPVPELSPHDTVAHAVEQLRLHRASLAVVRQRQGWVGGGWGSRWGNGRATRPPHSG
ncbi:CNNM domain-containing protein, partial [Streptomyces mirabilis]|uniref:CNNM domain-containing protein n=1 Tax=Streptomyces mirabilis TaxID=68239 RepID=UPI0036755D96